MAGEENLFEEIYRTFRARLFQYALSLVRSSETAEDAVHDAFVGVARQAAAGRAPRKISPYLYAAVRNRCLDILRRRQETPMEPEDLDLIAAPPGDLERVEHRQSLNRLLLTLAAEQREVVILRIWHDLGFAEIAALQACSINTALSRYQYALKNLRKELGSDE